MFDDCQNIESNFDLDDYFQRAGAEDISESAPLSNQGNSDLPAGWHQQTVFDFIDANLDG